VIWLLLGCPDGDRDDRPSLPESWVDIGFSAEGTEDLTGLRLTAADIVVEAEGPDGEVSVSYSAVTSVDLLDPEPDLARLSFDAGHYDEIGVEVLLDGRDDVQGITASGRHDGDEWVLEADGVRLSREQDGFDIPDRGGANLGWRFRPDEWLHDIELPDGDHVVLSPTSHPDIYERVLANLHASTTLEDYGPDRDDDGFEHGDDD
jgi:hypothetical protein